MCVCVCVCVHAVEMHCTYALTAILLAQEELKCGLEGRPVPGSGFRPDAYDRCYTVARIARHPSGRDALVRVGATPLLVRALSTQPFRSGREVDQWMHAITALHEFATSADHHEHLRIQSGAVDALLSAAAGRNSLPFPPPLPFGHARGRLKGWVHHVGRQNAIQSRGCSFGHRCIVGNRTTAVVRNRKM
eukprot:SAG31_NODE_530_length_14420_cov_4.259968_7_plen_190_part_00